MKTGFFVKSVSKGKLCFPTTRFALSFSLACAFCFGTVLNLAQTTAYAQESVTEITVDALQDESSDGPAAVEEEKKVPVRPGAKEILATLEALAPTFPAPRIDILASLESETLPVRLIGVDLTQHGTRLGKEGPRLDGKLGLKVTGYWLPLIMPLESTVPADIRLWSHDSRITKSQEIGVGPVAGEDSWIPGQVYKQNYEIELMPISSVFSGKCHMTISLLSLKGGKIISSPLQYLSLYLSPNVGRGRVHPRNLQAAVGASPHDLSVSFRLGHGAEHEVDIPAAWQKDNARIAVISAFGFGNVAQGDPVCEVVAKTESGGKHTWALASGIATARADYDFYSEGNLNHKKVQVVESADAEYLDMSGGPFRKHKFIGFLEVPQTLGAIKSLTFRSQSSVIFDVFDVVLLPVP